MRDLYAKKDLGLFSSNYTAIVPYHGVLALKLTPSKYVDSFDQWKPWDCGIETDTGEHGVWACFSAHPPASFLWRRILLHALPLPAHDCRCCHVELAVGYNFPGWTCGWPCPPPAKPERCTAEPFPWRVERAC